MTMNKHSSAEVGQVLKLAAENLRSVSAENQDLKAENEDLKTKVAHFEKSDQAEKIAAAMQEKGLEPNLSFKEKVAGLMKRDDLRVVEEAVGLAAPQMKLASVHDETLVATENESTENAAADQFTANLLSIGG